MQMKKNKKLLSYILCMILTVAVILSIFGCNDSQNNALSEGAETNAQTETEAQEETEPKQEDRTQGDGNVLGTGNTEFVLSVVDEEGTETEFEIHTDKETVGEALLEAGLIEGDESEYGLYVKTVNGITADYDKDGVYWAFYINGEYAPTGVDSTPIAEGEAYSFQVEE